MFLPEQIIFLFKWTHTILFFQIFLQFRYWFYVFLIWLSHLLLLSLVLFHLWRLNNFLVKYIWNFTLYFTFLLFVRYGVFCVYFNNRQKAKLGQCDAWRLRTFIVEKPRKGRFFIWILCFVFYVSHLSSIIKSLMYVKWSFPKNGVISSLIGLNFFLFILLVVFYVNALKLFFKLNKLLWSFTVWISCHITNLQSF